jgi:hypothetical protein
MSNYIYPSSQSWTISLKKGMTWIAKHLITVIVFVCIPLHMIWIYSDSLFFLRKQTGKGIPKQSAPILLIVFLFSCNENQFSNLFLLLYRIAPIIIITK